MEEKIKNEEVVDSLTLLTTETKELWHMIAKHGRRLNALEAKFETREEQETTIRCPECGGEFPASMLKECVKPAPVGSIKVCPLCAEVFGGGDNDE